MPTSHPRGPVVANLLAQIAFGLLAMTLCIPSMQDWATDFGASQGRVQLTFSAFVLAFGGAQLVHGPLSDRFGRKPVLIGGLALAAAGSVMAALATTLDTLILARALQGAGSAAGMVVGRALVQDLFDGPDRTKVMAWIGMTLGLCPPLGTLIGGQLHVRLGWQANFVATALLALLLAVAAWRAPRGRRPPPTPGPARGLAVVAALASTYARVLRHPSFLLYAGILATTTGAFYAFLAGAPIVLAGYGVGPTGIGWLIMVVPLSYIAGSYLTSRLVRRTGDRPMMVLGHALSMAGVMLLLGLAMAGLHTPLALALPLTLLGIGHGFLVPPTLAGTVGLVPALAGTAAALAGAAQQLVGAAGGYAVGLVEHDGAVNLGWLMLGFTVVAALAQTLLHRRSASASH